MTHRKDPQGLIRGTGIAGVVLLVWCAGAFAQSGGFSEEGDSRASPLPHNQPPQSQFSHKQLPHSALTHNSAPQSAHEQLAGAVSEFVESFFTAEELAGPQDAEDTARRVEIEISRIDPRLPLSLCEQPLIASLNQNQRPEGRINVKVECLGNAPWTKYVPVNVRVLEPVLVTTRPVARGEILSETDLSFQETDVSLLRGSYLQSSELAVGMEVKRSLSAGATLVQEALAAPLLIKRGDNVTLSAKAGTVEIRQQGVALQSGELGKRINVRNANSDTVVQAIVTGLGEAKVGF